jgi:hypothetical protein
MRWLGIGRGLLIAMAMDVTAARADPDGPGGASPRILVRSETHFQLYRRALLPGPYGAVITDELAAPVVEYVALTANDLDALGGAGTLDAELSAWGSATFGEAGAARRAVGDVQSAHVTYRRGPGFFRLGRQHVAGGAARYARFDGLSGGGRLPFGLALDAYAGLVVLPRWSERSGYHQLGAAADSLWRDPSALPEPERGEHWLAGGRAGYDARGVAGGVSVHEQRETGGLAHRNLGVDLRVEPSNEVGAGGNAVLDLDARRLADARLFATAAPLEALSVEAEVLHAEPALFLSRQSVLSVFSTDGYREAGGRARFRALRELTLTGSGLAQLYDDGELGHRAELGARVAPEPSEGTLLIVSLARVRAPGNGYVALRNAWRQRVADPLVGTLETHHYRYDDPIRGYDTSSVYAGTLRYSLSRELSVLWGASLARTPHAVADAQTRLALSFTAGGAP